MSQAQAPSPVTLGPTTGEVTAGDCAWALRALIGADAPLMTAVKARLRPYSCPFEVLIRFVPHNSRILDVGCGAGYLLFLLAKFRTGVSGVGIDQSAAIIDAAQTMLRRMNESGCEPAFTFKHVRGAEEWPREQFDVVTLIDVVHHVQPDCQTGFILEAAARVRPGGILLYKDMCIKPLWRKAANRLHDLAFAGEWIHEMAPQTVTRILLQSGFEADHVERIDRLCYGHELRIFRKMDLLL